MSTQNGSTCTVYEMGVEEMGSRQSGMTPYFITKTGNFLLLDNLLPLNVLFNYTPSKLCLWEGILFSRCPIVQPTDRPCVRNVLFPE